MSLLIWLPLDKENDLKSRGLLDNVFSKADAPTYLTSGKIGGCYSFDGTDDGFYSNTDKNLYWSNKEISFACWFKCDQTKASGTLIEIAADLTIHYTYNSSGIRFGYWRAWNNSGTRTGDSGTDSNYYNSSIWHHIAMVFDHQYNRLYVDGTLSKVWNSSSKYTSNWCALLGSSYNKIAFGRSYGGSSFIGGSMNDIRMYDHALSDVEVKEISRALICHYKLDGPLAGANPNLLQTVPTDFVATQYQAYKLSLTENLVKGDTYTLQMWDVDISHSGKTASQLAVGIYWGGGSISIGNMVGDLSSGHADYLYKTFTAPNTENAQADNAWLNIYNTPGWVTGSTVSLTIGKWKLEKGSKPTVYCKAELTLDTTKIIDSSGYRHHGTCTSTSVPVLDNDSIRRNICTKFDTTAKYIQITNLPAVGNIYSISWWMYQPISGASRMPWGYANGNRLNYYGYYCNTADGSSNPYYIPGTTTTISLPSTETWHHMVQVGDGTTVKLYKDGEWYGQAKTFKGITGTTLILNGWDTSTSYKMPNAKLSDFRLYATALSADDVLELYKVSAKIDNRNNIHAYDLNEYQVGKELLVTNWTKPFDSRNTTYTYIPNKGVVFNGYCSAGSDYIEINPAGNTYYYDIVVSIESGDYFLIGFERYDKDKTVRSNNACTYVLSTTPSSNIVKQRYTGTVNLSTDGVNACKYISLRVLNDWNNQNGKVATIHSISLREIQTNNTFKTKLLSTGVFKTDLLKEDTALSKVKIEKNVKTYINEFIEV